MYILSDTRSDGIDVNVMHVLPPSSGIMSLFLNLIYLVGRQNYTAEQLVKYVSMYLVSRSLG